VSTSALIVLIVVAALVLIVAARTIRIIPQARAGVVERLGRYSRTLTPGLTIVVPFMDRVKPLIDLRERVVSFPPQPVITEDNVSVGIDSVLYFTVTDAKSVTYEVANPLQAIEQLTVTTLRNIIGGMTLEQTLTSRDNINAELRKVLDEATGRWGIRVNRVELKSIDPPGTIQEAMEKQMRAERDRRATILNAEGVKQSQILTAEGEKQSAVLRAEGDRQSRILTAEGQAKAIRTVVDSIHAANPDSTVMAYQYLQALPQIAAGDANKLWIIPAEMTKALEGIGGALGGLGQMSAESRERIVRDYASQGESQDVIDARAAAEAASLEAAAAVAAASAEVSGTIPESLSVNTGAQHRELSATEEE